MNPDMEPQILSQKSILYSQRNLHISNENIFVSDFSNGLFPSQQSQTPIFQTKYFLSLISSQIHFRCNSSLSKTEFIFSHIDFSCSARNNQLWSKNLFSPIIFNHHGELALTQLLVVEFNFFHSLTNLPFNLTFVGDALANIFH